MKPYALSLPEELVDRLDRVAAGSDRSRSYVARALMESALAVERGMLAKAEGHLEQIRTRARLDHEAALRAAAERYEFVRGNTEAS